MCGNLSVNNKNEIDFEFGLVYVIITYFNMTLMSFKIFLFSMISKIKNKNYSQKICLEMSIDVSRSSRSPIPS